MLNGHGLFPQPIDKLISKLWYSDTVGMHIVGQCFAYRLICSSNQVFFQSKNGRKEGLGGGISKVELWGREWAGSRWKSGMEQWMELTEREES